MEKKYKIDLLAGTVFAGASIVFVKTFGYNSTTLMGLAYGYILLAVFLTLKNMYVSGSLPVLENFAVIVEEEETRLKKLWSGDIYRLKEVEKIGD